MKKYILWDNDGVLVDTEFWYFSATQRALAELGIALEKDTYLQRMVQVSMPSGLKFSGNKEIAGIRSICCAKTSRFPVSKRYWKRYPKPTGWPSLLHPPVPTSS
jgi:phosphoglycolate phosphatase-like HAD superfamily hydrolase